MALLLAGGLGGMPAAAEAQSTPNEIASSEASARSAFEAEMGRSFADRARRGAGLLVAGLASVAGSIPMWVPDDPDQAYRVGGTTTLVFGAVNAILGGLSLLAVAEDEERFTSPEAATARRSAAGLAQARRDAVAEAHSDTIIYAVNLGLDGLYLGGAVVGVVGSQAGFDDHPDRWLAAGIALGAQALFLTAFDAAAVALTSARHDRLLGGAPLAAMVAPDGHGGAQVVLQTQRRW
jgi:hypothetical protein